MADCVLGQVGLAQGGRCGGCSVVQCGAVWCSILSAVYSSVEQCRAPLVYASGAV
mgnify:CR=1 FL=1